MSELIDTTEMYLKTVFEMQEDGITPLRARIVERLGHSGPTVSQTVARMERDGLVHVGRDRRVEFTPAGRLKATEVMRKHRLAERLLLDVIGLEWVDVHDEACRWEHVMSDAVAERLAQILENTTVDPYGNPVPGPGYAIPDEQVSAAESVDLYGDTRNVRIQRIGEPVQADHEVLRQFAATGVRVDSAVDLQARDDQVIVRPHEDEGEILLPGNLALHLFIRES